jgi:hypothetical protein
LWNVIKTALQGEAPLVSIPAPAHA